MSKRPPSDAQRRAWARYRQTQATRPDPTVSLLRDEHVDQGLVGRRFIHQALGLLVAYEASAVTADPACAGREMIKGRIVGRLPGVGLHGGRWWFRDELEEVADGE